MATTPWLRRPRRRKVWAAPRACSRCRGRQAALILRALQAEATAALGLPPAPVTLTTWRGRSP